MPSSTIKTSSAPATPSPEELRLLARIEQVLRHPFIEGEDGMQVMRDLRQMSDQLRAYSMAFNEQYIRPLMDILDRDEFGDDDDEEGIWLGPYETDEER
ncbi:hypothetical protein PG996_000976 [Apiospora saccharicola]|uniref:Uncharacterized protein n=1 Tax=Apiospora saccharicola TaxID=335842 RepID=A0ABR1WFA9_9PEZI